MNIDWRRLGAVVGLVMGVFFALTLVPINLTGPIGRAVGPALWQGLGLGAIGVPVLGAVLGLAGLDRLPRLDMKRAAMLVAGAIVLIPYVLGVLFRVDQSIYLPAPAEWGVAARLTGWFPGFLAHAALVSIGPAGGLLAGFVVLTAVTLGTIAWHPLKRFEGGAGALAPAPAVPAAPSIRRDMPFDRLDVADEEGDEGETRQEELFDEDETAEPRRRRARGAGDDLVPPLDLLDASGNGDVEADQVQLQRLGELLLQTMQTFKVDGTLAGITSGPTVSQFEVVPAPGVKAGRIVALADDLAISMRATSLRVAPIPGRGAVGVEIPNPSPRIVLLRDLLESDAWRNAKGMLPIALGRDVEGRPVVADLARMPHLLVAGATGSGKSVAINTIITALIYRYPPRQLRLLMIDPKMVELSMYNDLPHLRHPVVTDNTEAAKALKWAVFEMNRRYELLHANGARQLSEFNRKVRDGKPMRNPPGARPTITTIAAEAPDTPPGAWTEEYTEGELPMIVVVVEELADLMMTVQGEVETPLAMLAQKARAIGIHLILATQRPSVNVLTGLIKANFPSRIAFRVAGKVDSRTILDQNGAEALLGNGDMLFLPPGRSEPIRVQGAYISTEETERIMAWYAARERAAGASSDESDIIAVIQAQEAVDDKSGRGGGDEARDPLFRQAAEACIQYQGGSTSLLQRRLGIGYGRAARIIDQLHDAGILGPPSGSKARDVLVGLGQLDEYV
jgi:DNA segregation ATPase FtsK/SpoIIIE, S-DNA-T family